MSNKRFWIGTGILALLAIFVHFYSIDSLRVENGYARGIYPSFAGFLRLLFGWLPFSIGDILYGLFAVWLLWKLAKAIKTLLQRKATRQGFIRGLQKTVLLVLFLYVVFNLFWGINYNRKGISYQLNLKLDTVSYTELQQLNGMLIQKLNSTKSYLLQHHIAYPGNREMFAQVEKAYARANDSLSFLDYHTVSIKPSLWGWLGNYTGFTGYYNPFTGEAQVNTTVPKFLQPFVACHEIAHQLGYAKENEANSVGYLTALYSGDSLILYSTYFDLYNYARNDLYLQALVRNDSSTVISLNNRLLPEVKADLTEMREFFRKHRNPIEPLIRKGYSLYLRNNNQPMGIRSYDEVIGFVAAFYKKFGRL